MTEGANAVPAPGGDRADSGGENAPAAPRNRPPHEAAWPDMFQSLQAAYAELTQAERELERRSAEIRQSRDLFLQVIESMSEALFLLDVSGEVERANPAAGRLLGAEPEELAGRPFSRLVGSSEIPSTPWEIEEQRRRGRTPADLDTEIETGGGEQLSVLVSSSVVRDEEGAVQGVLVVLRDVTERKAAQDRVRESLHEKEVLLREVHHRVKNNLQLVSSLLRLQARRVEDDSAVTALEQSRERIMALARIHETLYGSDGMVKVQFARYARTLATALVSAGGGGKVSVHVEADEIALDLDNAIPCGLILNELLSNSLRHAYSGDSPGEIRVEVRETSGDYMRLEVTDDGVGLPAEMDPSAAETLGLNLVHSVAGQIGARVEFQGDEGGTTVRVEVPVGEDTPEPDGAGS